MYYSFELPFYVVMLETVLTAFFFLHNRNSGQQLALVFSVYFDL